MTGDGNCLFRSFSYFIFNTQERHLHLRSVLVEFMDLNSSHFTSYCLPSTVQEHTCRMSQNFIWGTHAEILAKSLYFGKPVFVAMKKAEESFYWAKYGDCQTNVNQIVFPSVEPKLTTELSHFEICHVNCTHYDIVLHQVNNNLSCTPPFVGSQSTSIDLT